MPAATRTPRRRRAYRVVLVTLVSILGLGVAWFVTALVLFVLPRQALLHKADAVVALSPPSERLPAALEAFHDGLAPKLWVSYVPADLGTRDVRRLADTTCAPDAPDAASITCFPPTSNNTIGEAQAVAQLVEETGATSVIVTTHTTHATRTRFLFERCLPEGTEVQLLLVPEPPSRRHLLQRMIYETGALAKAIVQAPACDD